MHNTSITKMTIWGNHSATQYPDLFHAEVDGAPAFAAVGSDQAWLEGDFIPTVQQRGAAVIKARGLSSAASAANAAVDHVRSWSLGTAAGDWVSMGIPSDGSYGVPEGIISSFPVTCKDGQYSIVQGLDISDFSAPRIDRIDGRARGRARRGELPRPDLARRAGRGVCQGGGAPLEHRRTSKSEVAPLLQELRGRVVGQDLAVGLAGGAVGDGVADVLDRSDVVAAHRAGLADPVVHVAGAVG